MELSNSASPLAKPGVFQEQKISFVPIHHLHKVEGVYVQDVNSTIGVFLKKNYKFLGLSSKGTMYHMLKKIGCPILEVPDLSGRFVGSISNVGILPAFILGIDIKNFLAGLKSGYTNFMNVTGNSALNFAVFLYNLYKKGYKIVFSMPYSLNLEGSVGLFVQEISESTGKDEKD